MHCVGQAIRAAPKELYMILIGDLNSLLGYLLDEREKDLVTALLDRGLFNMIDYFMPRKSYKGAGIWAWFMQWEGRQVTGRGDYILSTDMQKFTYAGLLEPRYGTDHRMILAVLQGEGSLHNCYYIQGRTQWPIQPKAARPHTKG